MGNYIFAAHKKTYVNNNIKSYKSLWNVSFL